MIQATDRTRFTGTTRAARPRRPAPAVSMVAACLLVLAAPHALAVNKCIDNTGAIKYQADPCPDNTTQQVISAQKPISSGGDKSPGGASAPAATRSLAADDTSEDAQMLELISTLTTFEGCSEASPGFAQRNAGVYNAWRSKNAAATERYENTPRYKRLLENARTQMRGQPLDVPGAKERMAAFCDGQFAGQMKNMVGNK